MRLTLGSCFLLALLALGCDSPSTTDAGTTDSGTTDSGPFDSGPLPDGSVCFAGGSSGCVSNTCTGGLICAGAPCPYDCCENGVLTTCQYPVGYECNAVPPGACGDDG